MDGTAGKNPDLPRGEAVQQNDGTVLQQIPIFCFGQRFCDHLTLIRVPAKCNRSAVQGGENAGRTSNGPRTRYGRHCFCVSSASPAFSRSNRLTNSVGPCGVEHFGKPRTGEGGREDPGCADPPICTPGVRHLRGMRLARQDAPPPHWQRPWPRPRRVPPKVESGERPPAHRARLQRAALRRCEAIRPWSSREVGRGTSEP